MLKGKIGIVILERSAANSVRAIVEAERMGIPNIWMTLGGAAPDAMTVLAAAAVQTERAVFGTCIVPTYPRHPIVMAQQALALSSIAPGRFRLGVGPSHAPTIEGVFGMRMERPLKHLREYVTALRQGLRDGEMNIDGDYVKAHVRMQTADVPILISALRRNAFRLAGELTDGAISWVCPLTYLAKTALPAVKEGATKAGRPAPPIFAHVPVCVSTDREAIGEAAARQLGIYPKLPFYSRMFVDAGFPEAAEGRLTDAMIDSLVVKGTEKQVAERLEEFVQQGMGELVVTALDLGPGSVDRTKRFLGELSQ